MRARKLLSVLIVSLFLALSVPAPGWGAGGQDIVLDKSSSSGGPASSPKHESAAPRLRGSGRVNAGGARPLQQDPQTSWMTWVWNYLASMYGQFFRTSSDDARY